MFVQDNIAAAESLPPLSQTRIYWWQVSLVLTQLQGLYDGYQYARNGTGTVTFRNIEFLSLQPELYDLMTEYGGLQPASATPATESHCSALIVLTDNNADVLIAQTAWESLNNLMRIFKLYDFPFTTDGVSGQTVAAERVSFSSYPGTLNSGDDWYVLSSGLVVQETTIGYYYSNLTALMLPDSVFEYVRNIIANRIADSSPAWVDAFSPHNSGTYNNQWGVFDLNLFTPGEPLVNSTFVLLEQNPGLVAVNDLSQMLQSNRYFAGCLWPIYYDLYSI